MHSSHFLNNYFIFTFPVVNFHYFILKILKIFLGCGNVISNFVGKILVSQIGDSPCLRD